MKISTCLARVAADVVSVVRFDVFSLFLFCGEYERMDHIKRKWQQKYMKAADVVWAAFLPVTSCVSSWLLEPTMLTDTFLDDCRNNGRP